ncbi:MAG: HNH endonuclease [Proteobacteria bacterium]|nr:HNH endonuclease [Pseudomonadota bacterium]
MKPVETVQSVVPDLIAIDELEHNILTHCMRINVATYQLLLMIREFDERCGFLKWGLESAAEWLAWRCDFSTTTALEKVRVARALKDLPLVSDRFSSGELSYSKVRALTRVATSSNEQELVDFALQHSTAFVARRCQELRLGDVSSHSVAETAFASRSLRLRRDARRGMLAVTIELPLEAGELIEKALDKARDDECLEHPDILDTTWSKRQADAFVTMVKSFLAGGVCEGSAPDTYLVNVHVDQSALKGDPGRSSLPIETVRRLCCDGPAVTIVENGKGQPIHIGRKSRVLTEAIKRIVRARDNDCCRFPGCRNRRFLHFHHVDHWANGGESCPGNILMLCTRHHSLVHEGGFRIEKDFNDAWYFIRPDGVAVPEIGYRTQDMVDADTGELRFDPPRGGLLHIAEKFALEPPPPVYTAQRGVRQSFMTRGP